MARFIGLCILSVIIFSQSSHAQQCDVDGVLSCTNVYVDAIKRDAANVAVVCRVTKEFFDCVKTVLSGCSADIKRQIQPQLDEAQRNMAASGCNPDGTYSGGASGSSAVVTSAGCDPTGILQCTQDFLRTFNQNAEVEEICGNVRVIIGCVEPKMQDCNADAREQFDRGMNQYRKILNEQCGAAAAKFNLMTLFAAMIYVFYASYY